MIAATDDTIMVVHGPEAFDCGDVAWLIDRVRPRQVLVAGVMARTAAEESGLPVVCTDERPSIVMRGCGGRSFLVNRGKTPESGRIFGEIVAERLGEGTGLVHVECAGRTVYCWNRGDPTLARGIARTTGFAIEAAASARTREEGVREIQGCLPGEAVFVNGIVIGTATAETVRLSWRNGTIEPESGIAIKPHGIEKLLRSGPPDVTTAWCKSGMVRTAPPKAGDRIGEFGEIRIVDHCGHTVYGQLERGTCGILAIGDDTTAICGHICAHAGIPVFGVVDGDADGIVPAGFAPGSVVVEVADGRDDDVGRELAATLGPHPRSWDAWVEDALRHLAGRVRVVVDRRGGRDAMR